MRTITVKMAKPDKEDFDRVLAFFQGLEDILEEGAMPGVDYDSAPKPEDDATAERVLDWLEEQWKVVRLSWSRLLWAGKTAIDNACDPDSEVLEYRKEIREALEKHLAPDSPGV